MQSVYKITKKNGNFWKFQEKKRSFFLKISKFLKELLREFQKIDKFSKFLKELLRMPLFKCAPGNGLAK